MKETEYNNLKQKFNLPDFDQLNNDFGIEDIDSDSRLHLQKIRIKIYEKIEYYAKVLEILIQPDSSLSDMYEARYFSDNDREKIYSLYKKFMSILRRSNLVAIKNDEKETVEFIKDSYNIWNSSKDVLSKHVSKLVDVWKKDTDMKSDFSYFG